MRRFARDYNRLELEARIAVSPEIPIDFHRTCGHYTGRKRVRSTLFSASAGPVSLLQTTVGVTRARHFPKGWCRALTLYGPALYVRSTPMTFP